MHLMFAVRTSIFYFSLLYLSIVHSVHDSLNFLLPAQHRECFFEDFDSNTPTKTIEAFVHSAGNADVLLTIHGPLTLQEIRTVSIVINKIETQRSLRIYHIKIYS
jgi:hypothetical protein